MASELILKLMEEEHETHVDNYLPATSILIDGNNKLAAHKRENKDNDFIQR